MGVSEYNQDLEGCFDVLSLSIFYFYFILLFDVFLLLYF